jgi:hypothetical protein
MGLSVEGQGARGPPSPGPPVIGASPLQRANFRAPKSDERMPVGLGHLAHLPVAPVVPAVEAGDRGLNNGTVAIGVLGVEHEPPRHVPARSRPVVEGRRAGIVDHALGRVDRGGDPLRAGVRASRKNQRAHGEHANRV